MKKRVLHLLNRFAQVFFLVFPITWLLLPNLILICTSSRYGASLKSLGLILCVFAVVPFIMLLAKNLRQFWLWNIVFAFLAGFFGGFIFYYHDVPYEGMIFDILNASPDVITGTIKFYLMYAFWGFCGFLLYCFCLAQPIQKRIHLTKTLKQTALFAALIFIAIVFFLSNFFSNVIPIQRFIDQTVVFENYPFGTMITLSKSIVAFNDKVKTAHLRPIKRNHVAKGRELYVYVIGEAERFDVWTEIARMRHSPILTDPDIVRFDHVVSQANLTSPALELMLTGQATLQTALDHPLWFEISHAAGCKTGWITNAREPFNIPYRNDFYDLNIDRLAWVGLSKQTYDDVLIPQIARSIAQNNGTLCLTVHFKGSHFDYRDRYRADYAIFPVDQQAYADVNSPQHVTAFLNAYKNSAIQTDEVLKSILALLKKVDGSVFLLYAPDHAESFDAKDHLYFHGNFNPKKSEVEIPLFVWANAEYQQQFPEKWQHLKANQNRLISTAQIVATMMDAFSISEIPTDLAPSLLQNYKVDVTPKVLLPQMVLVNYAELRGGETPPRQD